MFAKVFLCSSVVCLALADVKHLPRTYLPPSLQEVVEKPNKLTYLPPVPQDAVQSPYKVTYATPAFQEVGNNPSVPEVIKAADAPDLISNQFAVENDSQSVAVAKEGSKDPIYGGVPFGGFPGAFPQPGFSGQVFPGQIYPGAVFPPQVFPGHGLPGPSFSPSPGLINSYFPPQVLPGQGFAGQGFPGQGLQGQGFPGQGFPGQGFPGQGFPGQGFYGQGPSGSGFLNAGFPGQAGLNYPVYFSTSEQLQSEANKDNAADQLRARVINSDTQYDDANGGYLYQKPSVTF